MKIVEPNVEILTPIDADYILKHLELCGRICYKSEHKITENSAGEFLKMIISRGHETVLEHFSITVKFICDRGVSHEIVRHRLASYCQESTRYCNYSEDVFGNEIQVICPVEMKDNPNAYSHWEWACKCAEKAYFLMLASGATPQIARSVLPNALKTELVMTTNVREWRHFFRLRCSPAAHPQMRQIAKPLLAMMRLQMPILFDDIFNELIT